MGVVEGSIFMARDLHFRIRHPIFGIGTNFQLNLTALKFRGVGCGCGHFPKFLGLGTLIFGLLVHFYIFAVFCCRIVTSSNNVVISNNVTLNLHTLDQFDS